MTDIPQHAAPPYEPVAVDAADILTVYEVFGSSVPPSDEAVSAMARMRGAIPANYPEDPLRSRLREALLRHQGVNVSAELLDDLVAVVAAT